MLSKRVVIGLVAVAMVLSGVIAPVSAQGDPDTWTTYMLNMRSGPGTGYAVITTLAANTGLIAEARTGDLSWVLARTPDHTYRGWLAGLYVVFTDGFNAWNLPVSDEVVAAPAPPPAADPAEAAAPGASPVSSTPIPYAGFDETRVSGINLNDYPPVPANLSRAREIYLTGRALDRDRHVLSKVGDCLTTDPRFLVPHAEEGGVPENLMHVVAQFGASFGLRSYAADSGYTTVAALAPTLADPRVCQPGETPLQCEIHVHNSSVIVIMLGTMDLLITTPQQFDQGLRQVIQQAIDMGTIPLLSTFPRRQDYPGQDMLYNQIIVQVAMDYNIPLMNLWVDLEWRPNHGTAFDGWHLSDGGFQARNMLTLQALDAVIRGAMY
ncbi:MAG: SGNH/GDSL hydrolase family protein [Anaerolineae bacterium]|nr:SGNH/GDSL hydrolase family protein [Anaerolineae bacterium]